MLGDGERPGWIAERNALPFIRAFKANPRWPAGETDPGAREYAAHVGHAAAWARRARALGWSVRPPGATANVAVKHPPLGLAFRETMQGFYRPTDRALRTEAGFRALEIVGRPEFPVRLELEVRAADLDQLRHHERRCLDVTGCVAIPSTSWSDPGPARSAA